MAWWNFSLTASANGAADPTQNWAEGESPSSLNDSARALLARSAEFRDLISGAIATTGTGTALVLASGQTPAFDTTAHMNGAMIAFTPNVTNTGAVTLAVDGLAAKPIRSSTGSGGNLGAGVLVQGTPYVCTYYDSVGEFILQGFVGQPYAVPLGSFLFHSVATVPNSNFVMPIGQAISRTTYAAYFAMVGTTFGVGDGVTTFNVPDLRSRIPVPLATMGGADPGRVTTAGSGVDGATVGAVGGAQNVTLDTTMIPAHTHTASVTDPGHGHVMFNNTNSNAGAPSTSEFASGVRSIAVAQDYAIQKSSAGAPNSGITASGSTGISVSNANTGGGLPHNNMPPVLVLALILRVF